MCNNHEGIHSGTVYYVSRIGDTILCGLCYVLQIQCKMKLNRQCNGPWTNECSAIQGQIQEGWGGATGCTPPPPPLKLEKM